MKRQFSTISLVALSALTLSACASTSDKKPESIPQAIQESMFDACTDSVTPMLPDRGSSKWAQISDGGWLVTPIPADSGADHQAVISSWWSPLDGEPWTVACTVSYANDTGEATTVDSQVGGV